MNSHGPSSGRQAQSLPVTSNDLHRSRTLSALSDLMRLLEELRPHVGTQSMLDVGCGFGGLPATIASHLNIQEVHGVDLDPCVIPEAKSKGVKARQLDVASEPLPYQDSRFDLITCFGMLDYLPSFDFALREMRRVSKPSAFLIVALPNLASWHNRLALLLGYQPRDVEVSRELVVGVHPHYRRTDPPLPTGHIHTVTTRGFIELAEHHGFRTWRISGSAPSQDRPGRVRLLIERAMVKLPALAKRFMYVGQAS